MKAIVILYRYPKTQKASTQTEQRIIDLEGENTILKSIIDDNMKKMIELQKELSFSQNKMYKQRFSNPYLRN